MPITKPTAWPTVWPPDGGYIEVATIAAYLNERVYAGRENVNARRVRDGKRPYSSEYEWQTAFLPLFPTDGWETRTDVPRFQVIGPIGVSGRGLHEYMGFPEITERINEMNALAAGSVQPTPAPPPVTEPPPPIVEEPPMPPTPPPDVSQPCPEGYYRNLFTGECEPIGTGGTGWTEPPPTPSPVTPHILILHGRHKIEGYFEPPGSLPLKLIPVALNDDNCLMWALSPNNYECWVKVVKSDAGYAVGVTALTNVKYEVTVTDQPTGKQQTFTNDQGNLIGDFRWNGLPT